MCVVVVVSLAVSPGTWRGGAWVPGGCFSRSSPSSARIVPGSFTSVTCKMGIAPIREYCKDFHLPILE